MQLPVVPSFTAGESNVQHLQQLSNAVSFLSVGANYPVFRAIKTATLALTAGSWQTIPYTTIELDTDSMHNAANGGIQINTQGYYRFEASLELQSPGSNDVMALSFLLTVGPNNANYSNGTTLRFGGMSTTFNATSNVDGAFTQADICPYVLYPNDTVVVQAYPSVNCTTDTLTNSGATAGWFAPQMSARWIRTGT